VEPGSAVVIFKILVKNGRRVNRETHFESYYSNLGLRQNVL
jgi:hypothetical protein